MRRCNAILLLGLLLRIEPASAQDVTIHPLKVKIHEAIYFPSIDLVVKDILMEASRLRNRLDE